MTEKERLKLRVRQILDDPTLSQNERVPNPGALLKQLKLNMAGNPIALAELLDSISDPPVEEVAEGRGVLVSEADAPVAEPLSLRDQLAQALNS